jgi:rod shape-determining protein MreD
MLAKILASFIFITIFLFQVSFVSALPFPFFYFNLSLVVLVLLLAAFPFSAAVTAAIILGVLSDLHAPCFFGANLASLLCALFFTRAALLKFFTNRSLYSYILLTAIATVFFELTKSILLAAAGIFSAAEYPLAFKSEFFLTIGYETAVNIAAIIFIFYGLNYFSKRLKSFFITKIGNEKSSK